MRIGEMTRENYADYAKMIELMNNSSCTASNPLEACKSGDFSLRFTPTDVKFSKPNWNNIPTKRDKPAMSEKEFEQAIKEDARKAFANGRTDRDSYSSLKRQFMEVASPDRKAVYEESMRKTGGKMNGALSFYNNSGQRLLSYHPYAHTWNAFGTDAEWARGRVFNDIYNGEMDRLIGKYGKSAMGNMDYSQIEADLATTSDKASLNCRV